MKRTPSKPRSQPMREEYDFSDGLRGKYVASLNQQRYRLGTNLVLLRPELAKVFPDSKSVNDALRGLVTIAKRANGRKQA